MKKIQINQIYNNEASVKTLETDGLGGWQLSDKIVDLSLTNETLTDETYFGKPVYRKFYTGTTSPGLSLPADFFGQISKIVSLDGQVNNVGDIWVQFPFFQDASNYCLVQQQRTGGIGGAAAI